MVRARARPERRGAEILLYFKPCREDESRARAIWRPLFASVLVALVSILALLGRGPRGGRKATRLEAAPDLDLLDHELER